MIDKEAFFRDEKWTAGIIGLGYVGLPLAVAAHRSGMSVVGFDVSSDRVSALSAGISPVGDVSDATLASVLSAGAAFTDEPADLKRADAIFICVPSPLGVNRLPDLSHIQEAAEAVEQVAGSGQLIVLESTTYPGTTTDYLVPAVSRAGLTLDQDVWVAYSPERVSPGDSWTTGNTPKVVGGVTPVSGLVAAAAYRRLTPEVHVVSSAEVAEMSKLLENTYRAVNIGLVNELAQLSHELDIDVWEVIDAAATKPFGFQAFYPGPGVGGHCIPLDPHYLAWRARSADFATKFIDTADSINSGMPEYTVRRIESFANSHGHVLDGARILALGISYKADVSDDRESASLEVARQLAGQGARVDFHDPFVDEARIESLGFDVGDLDDLTSYQLAVVLTDHSPVDYESIARSVPMVFDTRGVYRRLGISAPNVEAL